MIWIFGYGSLMWNPGFEFEEKKIATLRDHRRTFSLKATEHRGTEENPGLVLTLKKENASECRGVLFGVKKENWEEVESYLIERELKGKVPAYKFEEISVFLECNSEIKAITFTTEEQHSLYLKGLCVKEKAKIIQNAHGESGSNLEYYKNTLKMLNELGVEYEKIFDIDKHIVG